VTPLVAKSLDNGGAPATLPAIFLPPFHFEIRLFFPLSIVGPVFVIYYSSIFAADVLLLDLRGDLRSEEGS